MPLLRSGKYFLFYPVQPSAIRACPQVAFTIHYAPEYYAPDQFSQTPSDANNALTFPGDSKPDYWDFFYFSLVLGMTFQVSDVQITRRSLRRLAAAHGLLGFLFNTVILALSVNIGASLL